MFRYLYVNNKIKISCVQLTVITVFNFTVELTIWNQIAQNRCQNLC